MITNRFHNFDHRYDSGATFADNVELTARFQCYKVSHIYAIASQDPILQRFDILCVLQDVVDPQIIALETDF